ncbi:tubulin monoglutamylase TTLL4 [Spea bombifrons]|uniref:tubulin monoglutamylase TTLL4 n=1 Tax=Spea bombifrons TaxID=233779 RepID=UPI00234B38DC|nr:tubulin monoglutamylase TTLL4 [Spea bombifrons]
MASAETERYAPRLGHETRKLLIPADPERPKELSSGVYSGQASSVWKQERKCADVACRHKYSRCVVPQVYDLISNAAHPIVPSPPQTAPGGATYHPRTSNNTSDRTFGFQQPVNGHKPYQKLDPLFLRPKYLGQRPYSSSFRHPTNTSSALKLSKTCSTMTSSLIDQFHLPSAAGEPPDYNSRRPSSVAANPPCDSTRPTPISNSFLRPSSAKVPLHPHSENKKIKSPCLVGLKSVSSQCDRKPDFDQLNGNAQSLYHRCPTTVKIPHPPASPGVLQGSGRMVPIAYHILENGEKMDSLAHKEVYLTEAVQKLTENRKLLQRDSAPPFETSLTNSSPKDLLLVNSDKEFSGLHAPGQKDEASGGPCLHGHVIASAKMGIAAAASNPIISGQTAHSAALNRESQRPAMVKSQGENITVMATQISTIQLDKTCRQTPAEPNGNQVKLTLPALEHECTEEDLPDGLDDSQNEGEEEEEEEDEEGSAAGFMFHISANASLSAAPSQVAESVPVSGDFVVKPALTPSLFPNMPPTIYFGTQAEKVETMPLAQRKLLKWRMSTVTPNVVKQAVARSHFRVTKKNHDWLGCWGHHMKSAAFKAIHGYQKLNHFPGSFQIGRKDRLWRNLSKMQARFGRKEFNFFPQSFVLPQDIKLLRKAWEEGGTRQKWIVKPPASARGMGIQVIHKWSQLPKKRPLLVQRYLHKPYLISGSKFDLRIYVYVTCYDPLRVYLFTDGLVRFASCKYSSSMKSLSNKFMHLTNYSVNKKNADYKANSDETACQGHKWALKALWSYLDQKGFSSEKIWEKIKDMVIKTIIASEPYVNSLVKMYVQRPYSCHELFGFDIMLDENLKPWVLEVNISPSLHSNSQLDMNIKGQMVRDLLNLAGFLLPSKEEVASGAGNGSSSTSSVTSLGKDCGRSPEIISAEKMKRARFISLKVPDKDLYATVLDQLTPEDVRVLAETEDELSRCGQFERVFPSPISSRYLRFFEQPRYFNILTNQWEQKYYADRERGRDLLKSLCLMNFHTGSAAHVTVRSLPRSPGQTDHHLNGFTKSEVIKHSKVPLTAEGLKSFSGSAFHQSCDVRQQAELSERPSLSQPCAGVPESALVM